MRPFILRILKTHVTLTFYVWPWYLKASRDCQETCSRIKLSAAVHEFSDDVENSTTRYSSNSRRQDSVWYNARTVESLAAEVFGESNAALKDSQFEFITTVAGHNQHAAVRRFVRRHSTKPITHTQLTINNRLTINYRPSFVASPAVCFVLLSNELPEFYFYKSTPYKP